jgi:hypothetical protein
MPPAYPPSPDSSAMPIILTVSMSSSFHLPEEIRTPPEV